MNNYITGLFKTQEALTEKDYKDSEHLLMVDGIFAMGMGALCGGPFLAAFALAIGASNYEVGMLTTIALLSQLMQLPGLFLLRWLPRRRAITTILATLSRFCWLFIAFIPFLFKGRGMSFMIQWFLISAVVGSACGPAWNSLLREIVPSTQIGRIFAKRMALGSVLTLLLTLVGGYFVDTWKSISPDSMLYSYSILFVLGLLLGLVSSAALARVPDPTMRNAAQTPMMETLVTPLKDRNFRQLIVFSALWNFALNISGPFFIIYMLDSIKISMTMVTLLTVVGQLSNLAFLRMWGTFTDRYSSKPVLVVSGTMYLVTILAWSFTTMPDTYFLTIPLLFVINIVGGCACAGINLASTGIALKLSPNDKAAAYMTVLGLIGAAAGSLAPLVGGLLADFFASRELALSLTWSDPNRQLSVSAINFRALDFVFVISFVVGLYSMHRLRFVKEEGELPNRDVIHDLVDHVAVPLRQLTTIDGVRHLVFDNIVKLLQSAGKHLHLTHDHHTPDVRPTT